MQTVYSIRKQNTGQGMLDAHMPHGTPHFGNELRQCPHDIELSPVSLVECVRRPVLVMQTKLREMIKDAEDKNELWTRSWDTYPLPSVSEPDPVIPGLAEIAPSVPSAASAKRVPRPWGPVPASIATPPTLSQSTHDRSSDSDSDYSQVAGRLSHRRGRRSRSRSRSPSRSISRDP